MNYPKIKDIKAQANYQLFVVFRNGISKIYDCKPLLKQEAFAKLNNNFLFNQVHVDTGGYGIIWDEDIDLAESELWINGQVVSS